MPIYFFHVRHDNGLHEDLDGKSFDSLQDAKADAAKTLQDVIANELRAAHPVDITGSEITDYTGKVIATVSVDEAVIRPLLLS